MSRPPARRRDQSRAAGTISSQSKPVPEEALSTTKSELRIESAADPDAFEAERACLTVHRHRRSEIRRVSGHTVVGRHADVRTLVPLGLVAALVRG